MTQWSAIYEAMKPVNPEDPDDDRWVFNLSLVRDGEVMSVSQMVRSPSMLSKDVVSCVVRGEGE